MKLLKLDGRFIAEPETLDEELLLNELSGGCGRIVMRRNHKTMASGGTSRQSLFRRAALWLLTVERSPGELMLSTLGGGFSLRLVTHQS